jgi:hypothetical protein
MTIVYAVYDNRTEKFIDHKKSFIGFNKGNVKANVTYLLLKPSDKVTTIEDAINKGVLKKGEISTEISPSEYSKTKLTYAIQHRYRVVAITL